jgi:hypothetical protein
MARRSALIRVAVGIVVFAVIGVLFVRSVRSTRAAAFTVERATLSGWPLVQPAADPFGAWLAVTAPAQLVNSLGREIFHRGGESVTYPTPPLVPLLLRSEFERAFAGAVAPEQIVQAARDAGIESVAWTAPCMGQRRFSEPGGARGVHFLVLESAAFDTFRRQLATLLQQTGGSGSAYDPSALSPVLVVAALDADFARWFPLKVDRTADCTAPVEIS